MTTTVLVADDNRDAADSLAMLLRSEDRVVLRAYSVRDALDLLDDDHDIDIVVSDIRMPDVDGFDFFRVLRHRFPSIPMVLMTGLALTDDDVIPRGAAIVKKPFAIEELERVIAEKLPGPVRVQR